MKEFGKMQIKSLRNIETCQDRRRIMHMKDQVRLKKKIERLEKENEKLRRLLRKSVEIKEER